MTAIVLLVVGTYMMLAGLFGRIFLAWRRDVCGCGDGRNRYCIDSHATVATLISLIWPLALPVLLGSILPDLFGAWCDRRDRLAREKKEADERAAENLRLNIKLLEAHGIRASVDGADWDKR